MNIIRPPRLKKGDVIGIITPASPASLANALRRLHAGAERIPMEASPSTAHMFIVSPLSGGGFAKLFSTHPPMEERIARLEAMASGRLQSRGWRQT